MTEELQMSDVTTALEAGGSFDSKVSREALVDAVPAGDKSNFALSAVAAAIEAAPGSTEASSTAVAETLMAGVPDDGKPAFAQAAITAAVNAITVGAGTSAEEQKTALAESMIGAVPAADKATFAQAAMSEALATGTDAAKALAAETALSKVSDEGQVAVAKAAIKKATPADVNKLAVAAVRKMDDEAKAKFVADNFPQDSGDRMRVFVVGFAVAGIVVIALALVAWGVSGKSTSTANALLVLGTAFTSALLGGLLGALK